MDESWTSCRSVPGLFRTAHLSLLRILLWRSPSDAHGFGFLCLAWPILVPIALLFGVSALRCTVCTPACQGARQRGLVVDVVSLVGTLACGAWLTMSSLTDPTSAIDDNTDNL